MEEAMQLIINGKNLEVSDWLKEYVELDSRKSKAEPSSAGVESTLVASSTCDF